MSDPKPDRGSPLRTYLLALQEGLQRGTDHFLVVQDDGMPCDDFRTRMNEALAERPENLLAFFVPGAAPHGRTMRKATAAGQPWVQLRPAWIPTVALCWPRGLAAEFVAWHATSKFADTDEWRGDDGPVGEWASRRTRAWATVPSLIDHPNIEPSLIGKRAGAEIRSRTAATFHSS